MDIAGPWSAGAFARKCDATTDNKPGGSHARGEVPRWLIAAFKKALARLHRGGTVFASGSLRKKPTASQIAVLSGFTRSDWPSRACLRAFWYTATEAF